jgi:hypothetical protein
MKPDNTYPETLVKRTMDLLIYEPLNSASYCHFPTFNHSPSTGTYQQQIKHDHHGIIPWDKNHTELTLLLQPVNITLSVIQVSNFTLFCAF